MRLTMGVDVGKGGALAIYDADTSELFCVWDMPLYKVTVGRSARAMVDPVQLLIMLETARDMGVQLVVVEAVSGMSKDGAGSMFSFGTSYGYVIMSCVAARIPYDRVHSAVWKSYMKVGKSDDDILKKACEHFPKALSTFYGGRGGIKHDRCEAALLSKYAAIVRLDITKPGAEWRVQVDTENTNEDRRPVIGAAVKFRRRRGVPPRVQDNGDTPVEGQRKRRNRSTPPTE